MDLSSADFQAVNVHTNFAQPEDVTDFFSLTAPPNTNIWRKPSQSDETSAPMLVTQLRQSLILAEVTIAADFQMEQDQAGLIIFSGAPPGRRLRNTSISRNTSVSRRSPMTPRRYSPYSTPERTERAEPSTKWVKAGLEYSSGTINITSVVATSKCGSDWSTAGCMPFRPRHYDNLACPQRIRVKFERVEDALWIWFRMVSTSNYAAETRSPAEVGEAWVKMREVMGFFGGREDKAGVWVGCYASRPASFEPSSNLEEEQGLEAEFEDLDIL